MVQPGRRPVAGRHRQGLPAHVGSQDAQSRLLSQAESDGAASRAHVGDERTRTRVFRTRVREPALEGLPKRSEAQRLQGQVDQFLGLGTRDENGRRHLQSQAAEMRPAQDVGHRLVLGPARDERSVVVHLA